MSDVVLDSSALIAMIRGEPGGDAVQERLPAARILAVNLAETIGKLLELGHSKGSLRALLHALPIAMEPAGEDLAWRAGELRAATRSHGLSLGDRFCLAFAERDGLPVLTADKAWADLDLGVEVVLIR